MLQEKSGITNIIKMHPLSPPHQSHEHVDSACTEFDGKLFNSQFSLDYSGKITDSMIQTSNLIKIAYLQWKIVGSVSVGGPDLDLGTSVKLGSHSLKQWDWLPASPFVQNYMTQYVKFMYMCGCFSVWKSIIPTLNNKGKGEMRGKSWEKKKKDLKSRKVRGDQ